MKKLSKILVLVAAFAMICTGLIIAVGADNSGVSGATYVDANGNYQTAETLNAAFANAKAGTTVTLTGDTQISSEITITKNLTLDLNGYDLSSALVSTLKFSTANLKFTITGEGSITVDGALYSGTANSTFEIIGQGQGINVFHSGTASEKFLHSSRGTFIVKNVNAISTCDKNTSNAFFNDYTSASSTNVDETFGVQWYIDNVVFNSVTTGNNVTNSNLFAGLRFLSVGYNGYAKITNTTVNNTASIISILGASYKTADETIIDIDNCVFNAVANGIGSRSSIFVSSMTNTLVNRGTINLKNSTVKFAYNMVMHGNAAATEEVANNVRVNLFNSTVKGVGHMKDQLDVGGFISNNAIVRVDSESDVIAISANLANDAKLYVEEGARFSRTTNLNDASVIFPDGTNGAESADYAIVYDPIGNPSAPYVVAKKSEKTDNSDYFMFYNFEESNVILNDSALYGSYIAQYGVKSYTVSTNEKSASIDAKIKANVAYYNSTSRGTTIPMANECELYNFNGALAEYITVDNTALKYWIPAATVDGKDYANGSTLNISGGNAAPNLGLYEYTRNTCKEQFGNNAFTVAMFEIDIATDSDYGFPEGNFNISTRNASNSGAIAIKLVLSNNGSLNISALSGRSSDTVMLDMDGWNRISAVCYSDISISGGGRVYYYLNGELLGYGNISNTAATSNDTLAWYMQGFRFDVAGNQKVGSSILFDNISYKSYDNYNEDAGETVSEIKPDYYIANLSIAEMSSFTRDVITVSGIPFETVDDALKFAETTGGIVKLNKDVKDAQTVTVSGYVYPQGHTLKVSNTSIPSNKVYDANGDVLYYYFSKNVDDALTFHWQVGNILTGEYSDVTTVVKLGNTPNYDFNKDVWSYTDTEHKIYRQVGWNGVNTNAPLTEAYIKEVMESETEGHVYATANVTAVDMAQVIVNSNGELVSATDSTDIVAGSPLYTFGTGDTYILYKDCLMRSDSGAPNRTFQSGTYNIDLNGNTMRIESLGFAMILKKNCTLNVYSSAPGGAINKVGAADGSNVRGNSLLHMLPITDSEAKVESNVTGNAHNSVLNVGTISSISGAVGSNLTIVGDCVIEPRTGDESCKVNIEGATLIRVGTTYGALIYPRFYNGEVNVKDATLINLSNNYIISVASTAVAPVEFDYSTTASIDGCTVIQTSSSAAMIGATDNYDSITVKDTVIRGTLYEVSENVQVSKINVLGKVGVTAMTSNFDESLWAKYNVSFASSGIDTLFGDKGYYLTRRVAVSGGKLVESDLYITVKGTSPEGIPSGANVLALEPLVYMSIIDSETVDVSWKNIDGDVILTEKYIKGGNVVNADVKVQDSVKGLVATKKVFKSWGELPKTVSTNVTIEPICEVKEMVSGLKCNLSLYSDFDINLYIPAKYKDYITVYVGADKSNKLAYSEVILEGNEYLKVSIGQLCNKASEYVTFCISISEAGMSAEKNVSVSTVSYANTILASDDDRYTSTDKVLIYSMLDYANEAAKYFNNVVNDAVIAEILDIYKTYGNMYVTDSAYNAINNGLEDVFESVAIQLKSSPIFVFNLREGFTGTVTVSYAGGKETVTFNDFVNTSTTADARTLRVDGMKAYNFGTVLNITANGTINGNSVSVSGQFNLDSYVHNADTNNLEHFDLVAALRRYSDVSMQYKLGTLAEKVEVIGKMIINAPEVIYTNYSGKDLEITFTNPEYAQDIIFVTSDERVTVENGKIAAKGSFPTDTVVKVRAYTDKLFAEFDVTVKTYSANRVEPNCLKYEADGAILSTAEKNGTVFVGDSYFTLGYWKDFYEDFADENAYLLGIAGSIVDEWFMCSERLLYPLNPSEIVVHIGFNDIYGSGAHYTASEISDRIIALLSMYNEKFPDAKIYYCSVESSKWDVNYEKSFGMSVEVNAAVSEFADECDWLTFVNTRYIFCDDEGKVVYTDGDGNSNDDDDTGIYGQGSHPSVISYDEYKKALDRARGKNTEE